MYAQSIKSLKDNNSNNDLFYNKSLNDIFGKRSSMQRYNLLPRRYIFRGLAIYFQLGELYSGAKSLNSPC